MEKFYLELPSIERKNEVIDYLNEFKTYKSQIHGVGGLDKKLEQGISYEEWVENSLKMSNKDYAYSRNKVPATTFYLIRKNDNKLIGMID